jgi:hypothetical protein
MKPNAKKEEIKIDKSLFLDIYKVLCGGLDKDIVLVNTVQERLEKKFAKIIARQRYKEYLTSSGEDKAKAFEAYVESLK